MDNVLCTCTSLFKLSRLLTYRAVESGLKYKYFSSWDRVLQVLTTFYQVAGGSQQCQAFMAKVSRVHCDCCHERERER